MGKEYIITMTASNRVGMLAAVANAMAELDADLREIRQSVVRQFFSMIVAAEFPNHREPQVILDHLRDVCRPYDIEVQLNDPAETELLDDPEPDASLHGLEITGRNAPGILRQIATRLSLFDSDIRSLRASSSEDGQAFNLMMVVAVSSRIDPQQVVESLVNAGNELSFTVAPLDELT